jgi:hypothetical protein
MVSSTAVDKGYLPDGLRRSATTRSRIGYYSLPHHDIDQMRSDEAGEGSVAAEVLAAERFNFVSKRIGKGDQKSVVIDLGILQ